MKYAEQYLYGLCFGSGLITASFLMKKLFDLSFC